MTCKTQDVVPSGGLPSEPEIYARLKGIFRDSFGEDVSLTPSTTPQNVEGWDSFAHARLALAIETESKVRFSASDIERMLSVGRCWRSFCAAGWSSH